jgi:threonine/homoserine/homoserine lactone efflux protein
VGPAIGETLVWAFGIALSAIPLAALTILLSSKGGRAKGLAYAIGWFGSIWIFVLVFAALGDAATTADSQPTAHPILLLVLGVAFLFLAMRSFRKRPRDDADLEEPAWMDRVDRMNWLVALGLGVLLAVGNPKNIPLALAAAADFVAADLTGGELLVADTVFTLVASVFVIVVVAIPFFAPRAEDTLGGLRQWLLEHNAVILTVIFALLGVAMIGKAIVGFST